jgi:hypothetical protein
MMDWTRAQRIDGEAIIEQARRRCRTVKDFLTVAGVFNPF